MPTRKFPRRSCLIFSWAAALLLVCGPAHAADTPQGIAFFEAKIRPALARHCYQCHSDQVAKPKGGLRLDSREGILQGGEMGRTIVPGDVDGSPLISAIRHEDLQMPPKQRLPEEVIADFVAWVKMGAPYPGKDDGKDEGGRMKDEGGERHWSFVAPREVGRPDVKNDGWPRSDIDRFVPSRLEAEGLTPVSDAEPRVLIRRLYFDLIGLPPSPGELDRWISRLSAAKGDDPQAGISQEALAELVDELLESPHFGERWIGRIAWPTLARPRGRRRSGRSCFLGSMLPPHLPSIRSKPG